eukprot:2200811-Pleurochrysis_carterae.AAC.1
MAHRTLWARRTHACLGCVLSQNVSWFVLRSLLAAPVVKQFNFNTLTIPELKKFTIPFQFCMGGMSMLHGFALWFDCRFPGSQVRGPPRRHMHTHSCA